MVYVSKIAMFEYEFLQRYSLRYVGVSVIYICLKIIE
jgi:hypothetical protein